MQHGFTVPAQAKNLNRHWQTIGGSGCCLARNKILFAEHKNVRGKVENMVTAVEGLVKVTRIMMF